MEDNQVLLHSPPLSILKWVSKPLAIFTKGEKVEETKSSLATEAEARTNSELQQPQESTRLESQAPPESEAPNTSQTAPATMEDETTESDTEGFSLLQNGHKDMVETTAFNTSGDRFASGSVDGKIKVYNRHKDNTWHLCDTWGAHSSEILQLQWLPPTLHPNLIASTGIDGRFKLWTEDPTLRPLSGRRFASHSTKPIFELRSPPRAPYLSFSLSHNPVTRHTYLALISRSAHLVIYENEEPEDLTSWTELDRILVCDTPARGEEVSFRIQFDPNPEPCYTALKQGVPREAISLIVASMSKATIWRTKEISHSVSLGSSTSKEFYLAAELKGHRGLVRDVAWAPGNVRGFDIVATACKDGFVRVYELSTPLPSLPPVAAKGTAPPQTLQAAPLRSKDFSSLPPHAVVPARSSTATENGRPSGIGAGLAGARPWTSSAISSSSAPSSSNARDRGREGEVLHVVKEVSKMEANRSPVWRVDFDDDGQVLGSCGDDGKLILYRREPSGVWSKSSELAMTRSVIN